MKNLENNGTGEIGLVTPTPEAFKLMFLVWVDLSARKVTFVRCERLVVLCCSLFLVSLIDILAQLLHWQGTII